MAETKILITIKSGTTPIGFGNLQEDDGISVAHGGLGINYVAPNRILLGNSSLTTMRQRLLEEYNSIWRS